MFKRLRQKTVENLGIKITSLILALAVYAHVYTQQDHTAVLRVPLVLEGLPSDLTVRGEVPEAVRVRFRAKGGELFKLRAQPPTIQVNLSQARPGRLQRPVTTGDVALPPDAEAQAEALMEPVVLSLEIEPRQRVTLPVDVRLTGTPGDSLVALSPVVVWPETVSVAGPRGLVEGQKSISTEPIDLNGRTRTVEEMVRLRAPQGLRVRPETVSVRVALVKQVRRDFGLLPVRLPPALRAEWEVDPESVRVALAGPRVLLDSVTRSVLRPLARPAESPAEGDAIPVELTLPASLREGAAVVALEPQTVLLLRRKK